MQRIVASLVIFVSPNTNQGSRFAVSRFPISTRYQISILDIGNHRLSIPTGCYKNFEFRIQTLKSVNCGKMFNNMYF